MHSVIEEVVLWRKFDQVKEIVCDALSKIHIEDLLTLLQFLEPNDDFLKQPESKLVLWMKEDQIERRSKYENMFIKKECINKVCHLKFVHF